METPARNSRFSTKPTKTRQGKTAKVQRLSECDTAVCTVQARYPLIDPEHIGALTGFSAESIKDRLNILKRDPNNFVALSLEQRNNPSGNLTSRLFYENTPKAEAYLSSLGFTPFRRADSSPFGHQVMTHRILASFEIGVNADKRVVPLWPEDLIASEKTPEKTRNAKHPFQIPVSYTYKDKRYDTAVRPDAKVFGFNRTHFERGRFIFIALEVDCGNEPVQAKNYERTHIARKFIEYDAIIEQEIHKSHFGIPNLYPMFITTSPLRQRSFMDCLASLSLKNNKYFAFSWRPDTYSRTYAPATGHMFTRQYERVGHEPLSLI
jgi:hypothetical protein